MRRVLVLAWISPTLPKTLSDVRQPFQMACVKEAANVMHEAELRPYIEACQLGERRAQRFIFERYYRLMFGVCLRYMSDTDSVQDIVQEGFLKVFNNIEGYTFKGSFEGWMRRIMVNTAIDAIRRRNAAGWVLGDEGHLNLLTKMGDGRWKRKKTQRSPFMTCWMPWSI